MKIAVYHTPDKNILIKNLGGRILLKRRYQKKGNFFTLPYQKLVTKNRLHFIKFKKPNYQLLNILFQQVPPERNYRPKDIKIMKSKIESSKACIYPALGDIYVHPEFLDGMNAVEKKQVLFHEMGHLYYTSEEKADLFAATVLFILGYSPYQIMKASRDTLSVNPYNFKRWKRVLKFLKKAKR